MPVYKPTIQRGISDEGPISSNFLKPEEFDELPVKSHAIITPDLVPKSPAMSLRTPQSPSPVIKRSQNASANRRNLCLDLKTPSEYQLSKTDSLAAFLKYENDLNCLSNEMDSSQPSVSSPFKLSEKDLKDKSNSLNKKSFSRTSFDETNDSKTAPDITASNLASPFDPMMTSSPRYGKLAPIDKSTFDASVDNQYAYGADGRFGDTGLSIDSQLINSCDNLKYSNLSKLLPESLSSSSLESNETTKHISINAVKQPNNGNNSESSEAIEPGKESDWESEKRSPKRQLQLRKNHLLFDGSNGMLNEQDNRNSDQFPIGDVIKTDDGTGSGVMNKNDADACDERMTMPSMRKPSDKETKSSSHNNPKVNNSEIEALFDDFDLEEFIATFNDNEQFPIFKNFRDLATARNCSESNNNSCDGSSDDGTPVVEHINHDPSPATTARREDTKMTNDRFHGDESMPIRIPSINTDATQKFSNRSFDELVAVPEKDVQSIDTDNAPDVIRNDSQIALTAIRNTERDMQNNNNELNRKYSSESPEQLIPVDENGMSQAERELLASVNELNRMCDSPKMGPLDSNDDLASVESYPFCSDSAYGRFVHYLQHDLFDKEIDFE